MWLNLYIGGKADRKGKGKMTNYQEMTIEELGAAWGVAYSYLVATGDNNAKETLDAISNAIAAKVSA